MNLALEKIAEIEKLEATEEEINAEYEKQAKAYGVEIDVVKSAVAEDIVKKDIVLRKAVDLVKDNAVAEKPKAKKTPAKKKSEDSKEKAE